MWLDMGIEVEGSTVDTLQQGVIWAKIEGAFAALNSRGEINDEKRDIESGEEAEKDAAHGN